MISEVCQEKLEGISDKLMNKDALIKLISNANKILSEVAHRKRKICQVHTKNLRRNLKQSKPSQDQMRLIFGSDTEELSQSNPGEKRRHL